MPCGEDQFVLFHLCPPTHGLWSHYGTNNWLIQNKYQRRMRKTNIFERDIMNHHWNLTCVLCLSPWSMLQVILGDDEGDPYCIRWQVSWSATCQVTHLGKGEELQEVLPLGRLTILQGGHFWPLGNQNIFIDKMLYISQFPPSVLPILRSVTTCFCLIVMKGNI